MASLELPNTDFFNLNQSVTQLLRALDDAKTQRTVRRGARQSVQAPTQQSEAEVQGDLRTVLQNPLAKREPRGYGALKLDAVRSIRPLHESLVRLARGNVVATDAVDNDDTNAELHVRLRDFVESVDPVHPFLQVPLETNDTSGGGDVEGERGEAGGEQVQKEGEDAATETQNTVKKQQQQKGKQTLSKKARGKQRADPNVSHGKIQTAQKKRIPCLLANK